MILGLRGRRGSGRSTVAAYLMKQHQFERRAFADPLKKSIAATLNIPYHEIDKWKNDPNRVITVHSIPPTVISAQQQLTFRELITRYAEQGHKELFGDDFWVDQVLPTDGFYAGKKIVIPDIHFGNEARRIRHLGGFVVEVIPGIIRENQHSADVDYFLYHTGVTRELYWQIEEMLISLGSPVPE
jgi:hypothetical protein